jgi:hypothetical protein
MTQGDLIYTGSLEAITSRDHSSSWSTLPEHPPQIIRQSFRFFICRKMATGSMFGLEHEVPFGAKEPTKHTALSLDSANKAQKERRTLGETGLFPLERKIARQAPSLVGIPKPGRRLTLSTRSRSLQTPLDPPARTSKLIPTSTLTHLVRGMST